MSTPIRKESVYALNPHLVLIQFVVLIQFNAAPRAIALTVPMSACVLLLSDLRCSGGCNRPPTQGS